MPDSYTAQVSFTTCVAVRKKRYMCAQPVVLCSLPDCLQASVFVCSAAETLDITHALLHLLVTA